MTDVEPSKTDRSSDFIYSGNFFLDCREVAMMVLEDNGPLHITLKGNATSAVFPDHVFAKTILDAYRKWVVGGA